MWGTPMFGAGVLTTLQKKPTVVPISIHFNDTLRLYLVWDSFSQIICMQLQYNTKTIWIKLTKQYEGNGAADDVLQQVWQFDDTCLFFFVYQTFTFHTAQPVSTVRRHLRFIRLIRSPHFTVSFNTCYTSMADVYFVVHIPCYWLCWGHRHVDAAQHVL